MAAGVAPVALQLDQGADMARDTAVGAATQPAPKNKRKTDIRVDHKPNGVLNSTMGDNRTLIPR